MFLDMDTANNELNGGWPKESIMDTFLDHIIEKEHSPNREEIQRLGEQKIDNMIRQFKDTTHVNSPSTSKIKCPARITSSCQTDEHPGTPYAITEPLPPIFSSKFCLLTSRIKYLSN